jgi:ubiquinone/menaquinone biosynthesis C-methylase UbiE
MKPSAEPILRHAYGYWASAIFAAAIDHDLFTQLEAEPSSVVDLAKRLSLTERVTQALLDALLGMALVQKSGEKYRNSEESSVYLVRGRPDYLGGYAAMIRSTWRDWEALSEVVTKGKPLHHHENANPSNEFWESLVPALAPLGFPPARAAAARLRLAERDSFRALDIAGGAGAYSATWLQGNPRAQCVQLDWPNVNAIARKYVAQFGVGERFETIDGDMEVLDLGEQVYDYVLYANIAHGLSAARNTQMFRKIKRALKPGGTLLIVGLLPSDDRTGDSLLMMFNVNMILNTEEGSIHVRGEYDGWLREAGFARVEFEPLRELPFTLVYAS